MPDRTRRLPRHRQRWQGPLCGKQATYGAIVWWDGRGEPAWTTVNRATVSNQQPTERPVPGGPGRQGSRLFLSVPGDQFRQGLLERDGRAVSQLTRDFVRAVPGRADQLVQRVGVKEKPLAAGLPDRITHFAQPLEGPERHVPTGKWLSQRAADQLVQLACGVGT